MVEEVVEVSGEGVERNEDEVEMVEVVIVEAVTTDGRRKG